MFTARVVFKEHFSKVGLIPKPYRQLPEGISSDDKFGAFEQSFFSVARNHLPHLEAVAATNEAVNRDIARHQELERQHKEKILKKEAAAQKFKREFQKVEAARDLKLKESAEALEQAFLRNRERRRRIKKAEVAAKEEKAKEEREKLAGRNVVLRTLLEQTAAGEVEYVLELHGN